MRGNENNAYLTVYLALCLAIIMSLCLTLIDGVRRNGARLEVECVTDIALQSIMAEYHRELMKQYNLFAIDASYGTAFCGKTNTEAHLQKYIEKNLSYDDILGSKFIYRDFFALHLEQAELTKVSLMTDYGGAVFRKCAVEALGADIGLGLLQDVQEWMQVMELNGLENGGSETQKQEIDKEIESYDGMEVEIEENEWETISVSNPTDTLEAKRRLGILKLVIEDEEALSSNAFHPENLVLDRMQQGKVNQGNVIQGKQNEAEQLIEKFLFQEYLLKYMGHYGAENEEDVLHYQIEYLIAGKESDIDNLRSIANRICVIREAANALYLLSDDIKRMEIEAVAASVCLLAAVPELTSLLEAAILLGWAYAESIYDVKSIIAGGRIPLLKDDKSWHYGLSAALGGNLKDGTKDGEGLSYEDYMRIFMMLTNTDTLTARAMNMVEADIRNTPGNAAFRMDGCYDTVEAYIQLNSAYGYHYEITRKKSYR